MMNRKYKCQGLIFKGYSQVFYSNNRLEHKQGFRLLKRASCPDCLTRKDGIWDYVKETINEGSYLHDEVISDWDNYTVSVVNDGEIVFKKLNNPDNK